MNAPPLYGRFQLGIQVPLPQLLERLKLVSARYLQGAPFHAYITDRSGQTAYGLSHEALLLRYEAAKEQIRSISTAATGPALHVVRVHIHFDPQNQGRGQFVVAVGNKLDNERIRALLLGHKLPIVERKRLFQPDPLNIPRVPRLSFTPEGQAFQKATVTLNDQFYFDRNLSIYALLALLDEISDRYMDYRSFHAQLETTDGDFYFDIQREELRYLFNHRRHTLLALYLDVSKREGHWIDLMLSFHPLARGFNGEVEICAPGPIVDEINSLIWEALAVAPEQVETPLLEASFDFEGELFEVEKFVDMFEGLVARHLFRVPPVVTLVDGHDRKFTGLSFFQLVKLSKSQPGPFRSLQVEVKQVATGQSCQLGLFAREKKGSLRLHLGDAALQELLKNLILNWFESQARS
jgi:hypothetical protein